jgi:hypothetical protein
MDTDQAARDRIAQILKKHLELAREQLDMAERGVLLSIDGALEGINLMREALAIRVEQSQGGPRSTSGTRLKSASVRCRHVLPMRCLLHAGAREAMGTKAEA